MHLPGHKVCNTDRKRHERFLAHLRSIFLVNCRASMGAVVGPAQLGIKRSFFANRYGSGHSQTGCLMMSAETHLAATFYIYLSLFFSRGLHPCASSPRAPTFRKN